MRPITRFPRSILAAAAGAVSLFPILSIDAPAQSARHPLSEGRSALEPPSRIPWLERVERARARYEAFAGQARLALHPQVREPGAPPPKTGFLNDSTLRPGDVVVTPQGLMVFRGSRRFPYIAADFDAVRSPAPASAGHAPELIELQRAQEWWKP